MFFNSLNDYWQIVSVEFLYDGVPLLKLKIRRIIPVEYTMPAGLYDNNDNLKLTWPEVAQQFYLVNTNGSLSINGEYYKENLDGRLYISSEVTELSDNIFVQAQNLHLHSYLLL